MDIPLQTLKEITNNFSEKIGSGGYGNVYKGLYNGEYIAVKKLHHVEGFDENPFGNEFLNLLSIKHPHVVRLVGYCYEIKHKHVEYNGKLRFSQYIYRILCFEYMEGGSLDKYLEGSHVHDWCTRYNIIKGICEGLNFLHEGCGSPIIHLDLKPANILLDKNMVPKIADFGLSRLSHGATTHITQKVIGTKNYMAPEYFSQNAISPKNDVFSLGVIIIEVLDGSIHDYDFSISEEVKMFHDHVYTNWTKWINTTTPSYPSAVLDQVDTCIKIAIQCMDIDKSKRPTAAKIVQMLRETEKMFPDEWRNHACFLLAQSLPTPTKSGLVGGTAGSPRDIEEKPCRLESVTISYLGLVDAFSFSYIDQAGNKHTIGPWGDGYSLDKTETILFGTSEFVEEVSGTYGVHFGNVLVMSLTFVTNMTTYGPFGNPYHQNVPATPFKFRADEDSSITGFHGRSGQHIYSIGVYTCGSNKPTVGARSPPGQSLPPPTKSKLIGGNAGIPRDLERMPWRLDSLTIGYLGLVDAFSFTYTDQSGRKQSIGPWGEGYHHDKIETIRFGPSEVLKEVSGAYGSHFDDVLITSLTFVTNVKSYGPYGNPRHQNVPSTPFSFKADKDSSIVGFHGRSRQHIHSIGVYTV